MSTVSYSSYSIVDLNDKYTHIRYSANSDGTNFNTTPNKYIGIYTGTSETAPTNKYDYKWSQLTGNPGTSVSVSKTETTYQVGTSNTTKPTGTWSTTTPPTDATNKYLWTKVVITFTDGKTSEFYSVSSTIDSIEIGGRNLLINSNKYTENNPLVISTKGTDTAITASKLGIYANIEPSTTYILQACTDGTWGNHVQADEVTHLYLYFANEDKAKESLDSYTTPVAAKKDSENICEVINVPNTGRAIWKITTPQTPEYVRLSIRIDVHGDKEKTYNIKYWNFKLEKGNVPTDWTPAPEDIDYKIETEKPLINGNHTSGSYTWTGEAPFNELKDGQRITYWLPYTVAGSQVSMPYWKDSAGTQQQAINNGAVLNLTLANGTKTGNIALYYGANTRLTSHYAQGNAIELTYRKLIPLVVNGTTYYFTGWWANANYYSDTIANRIDYFAGKTSANIGIWSGSLFMEDGNGTYQNICTASDGTVTNTSTSTAAGYRTTAKTKKANPNGFKLNGSIYYSNTSYNKNTAINGWGVIYASTTVVDSRYMFNTELVANSLTPNAAVYLVGTIKENALYYLDTVWWTQTPNNKDKIYVLIGYCFDSNTSNCRISLLEHNIWYKYNEETKMLEEYNGFMQRQLADEYKKTALTVDENAQAITSEVWKQSKYDIKDANGNTVQKTMQESLTYVQQDLSGITSTVSDIETTIGDPSDTASATGSIYARTSQAQQTADKFYWIVDSGSSQSSLTMTDNAITAITDKFIIKDNNGSATVITGGKINANSITTDMLSSSAIKSKGYSKTNVNTPYSNVGTFLNLENGNFYTPNFGVINDPIKDKDGNTLYTPGAYMNGTVVATSGKIGDDSTNYWSIGAFTDSDSRELGSLISHGDSFIQNGRLQLSGQSLNTQWYATNQSGGMQLTYNHYDNKYYDYGLHAPMLDTTNSEYEGSNGGVAGLFLYGRKSANNSIPTESVDWDYFFSVDKDGVVRAKNLYINGTSIADMITSGVDGGAYLPTSGGTVNGNVTITGTLTATADKANKDGNGNTITSTYHKLAGSNTNSATNTFSGTNTFSKTSGFNYSGIESASANAARPVWFSYAGLNGVPVYNANFMYNPGTGVLTVGSITGTAEKAKKDEDGNVIKTTYLKANNSNLTGSTYAEDINTGSLIVRGDARFVNTIQGDISGNAATATSSTKATQDGSGNVITSTYVKKSGDTMTGVLSIEKSAGDIGVMNKSTTSNVQVATMVGSGQINHGLYSWGYNTGTTTSTFVSSAKWMVYRDANGNVILNGNAATATKATQDGSGNTITSYYEPKANVASKGGVNQPIYFDANGVAQNTTYTLGASVPSNAVFTDHITTATTSGSGNAITSISASDGALIVTKGNTFVDTSSNQSISGKKTFNNVNDVLYATTTTGAQPLSATALSNPPWVEDMWHDHFAFLRYHSVNSQEKTLDGTTWVEDNKNLANLFMQKEHTNQIKVLEAEEQAYRFVLKNSTFAYSGVSWFEVAVGYTSPFSQFTIKIEYTTDSTLTDSSTWKTIHESEITGTSQPYFLKNDTSFTSDGYLRFTFTKTNNLTTGSVAITCIKAFCIRKGSQGLGREYMLPYDWDTSCNILPISNNTKSLGSSSAKWANVYATIFTGNLSGNAATATKATKIQDSNDNSKEITVTYNKTAQTSTSFLASWNGYELGSISPSNVNAGKVNGHTVNSDVPSDAVFTDTTYEEATTSTSGLLSASDKSKLDQITVSDIGTVGANSIKGEKGISSSISKGVATIGHSQSAITAVSTAYGGTSTGTASSTLSFGGKFAIPYVTYDAYGHVTGKGETILALPSTPTSVTGSAGSATNDSAGNNISTTYLKKSGGTMAGDLEFNGTQSIYWSNGTVRQKIAITDDSIADTNVFSFQQSTNSGSSFTNLMTIKDNGEVVANKFTGELNGNASSASSATQLETARNITIGDATKSFNGTSDITYTAKELGIKQQDLVPITTKSYTGIYSAADNDANNYKFYGKIIPDNYKKLWKVKVKVTCYVPSSIEYYTTSVFEINGMRNTYTNYSCWNSIENTSYKPFWYNTLRFTTSEANSTVYGHLLGISLVNSPNRTSASYTRNLDIELLEIENCTLTFFDTCDVIANTLNSDKYSTSNSNFDASNPGLREYGDDNTYDRTYMSNAYLKNNSNFRLSTYPIFGYTIDNKAMGISLYSSEYTGNTTGVNTARVYNTGGFYYKKQLNYLATGTNHAKNADINQNVYFTISAIDIRYSDNAWYSYNPCNFGMRERELVYLRGIIKEDGLFYLQPYPATQIIVQGYYKNTNTFVTTDGGSTNISNYTSLNSNVIYQDIKTGKYYTWSGSAYAETTNYSSKPKYQKVWTQDVPTSVEKNSEGYQYVYWLIGIPYRTSSYINGQYQVDLYQNNDIYWYHNNQFEKYEPSSSSAEKLNSSAGSLTQPIFFEDGVPKATTYSLEKSVPSDAKFTDHEYTGGTGITLSGSSFNLTSGVVTAATNVGNNNTTSLGFGNTFTIPYFSVDTYGRVTGTGTKTMTLPSNPNTDYRQRVTLATTSKAYITGVTTAPTSSNQDLQAVGDTGVYLTTEAGQINAKSYKVDEHVTLKYDTNASCLKFVFS